MSIQTPEDLRRLREVGQITTETLDALVDHARAGVATAELDAIAAAILRRYRARSAPALTYGFPAAVLISVNDEVVHGIPGRRRLRDGDLVSIDVTVEKNGYVADAARSLVIGNGSALARQLVTAAEAALSLALQVVRAGVPVNEIGRVVEKEVKSRGFRVVRALCGHGVGRSIHEPPEVPNFYSPSQRDVLTEHLVLTIEPIIAAGDAAILTASDGWTLRTRDGSLAAHCEHTLLVTRAEPMILAA